jgi:hypothetical protein
MEFTGLLTHESLENAFIVGLLLTGNIEQAERAVLESVECPCPDGQSGEDLFRRVILFAVDAKEMSPNHSPEDLKAASSILPFELGCVLALPPALRQCYVLRVLVEMPREICALILHMESSQVRQRTQAAMLELAEMHRRGSRGTPLAPPSAPLVKAASRGSQGLFLVQSYS